MITDEVIHEMYQKYKRPPKDRESLNIPYFLRMLQTLHRLKQEENEIVNYDLEEFNPFRRFHIRSINGILEFDKMVAFIFPNHILFFGKDDPNMRVHIRPERKPSFLSRILGR